MLMIGPNAFSGLRDSVSVSIYLEKMEVCTIRNGLEMKVQMQIDI